MMATLSRGEGSLGAAGSGPTPQDVLVPPVVLCRHSPVKSRVPTNRSLRPSDRRTGVVGTSGCVTSLPIRVDAWLSRGCAGPSHRRTGPLAPVSAVCPADRLSPSCSPLRLTPPAALPDRGSHAGSPRWNLGSSSPLHRQTELSRLTHRRNDVLQIACTRRRAGRSDRRAFREGGPPERRRVQ